MKKLFLFAFIVCLIGIFYSPVFAQEVQNKLNRYVTSQLTDEDKTDAITSTSLEEDETDEMTLEQLKKALQKLANSNGDLPEISKDLSGYITGNALSSATGEINAWEKRRSELYKYVQSSNWITGKDISDGDRAFRETLSTIAVGLIKQLARKWGCDLMFDRMEEKSNNAYENSEDIQVAAATVAANLNDALHSDDHTVNTLYIDIQHNAFNILGMSFTDFKKVSTQYPEVKFLFEDMYTFFKWRYELRDKNNSYKLNENNINVKFRLSSTTNSFFAFWELANIAKSTMRHAADNKDNDLTNLTVSAERDNMEIFENYARQALYFGRIWNGMQRYAVKRGVLPENLNPERGARKKTIKRAIKSSFKDLNNEQVANVLDEVRNYYVSAREVSENYWSNWVKKQKNNKVQANLEEMLEQIQQITDNLTIEEK